MTTTGLVFESDSFDAFNKALEKFTDIADKVDDKLASMATSLGKIDDKKLTNTANAMDKLSASLKRMSNLSLIKDAGKLDNFANGLEKIGIALHAFGTSNISTTLVKSLKTLAEIKLSKTAPMLPQFLTALAKSLKKFKGVDISTMPKTLKGLISSIGDINDVSFNKTKVVSVLQTVKFVIEMFNDVFTSKGVVGLLTKRFDTRGLDDMSKFIRKTAEVFNIISSGNFKANKAKDFGKAVNTLIGAFTSSGGFGAGVLTGALNFGAGAGGMRNLTKQFDSLKSIIKFIKSFSDILINFSASGITKSKITNFTDSLKMIMFIFTGDASLGGVGAGSAGGLLGFFKTFGAFGFKAGGSRKLLQAEKELLSISKFIKSIGDTLGKFGKKKIDIASIEAFTTAIGQIRKIFTGFQELSVGGKGGGLFGGVIPVGGFFGLKGSRISELDKNVKSLEGLGSFIEKLSRAIVNLSKLVKTKDGIADTTKITNGIKALFLSIEKVNQAFSLGLKTTQGDIDDLSVIKSREDLFNKKMKERRAAVESFGDGVKQGLGKFFSEAGRVAKSIRGLGNAEKNNLQDLILAPSRLMKSINDKNEARLRTSTTDFVSFKTAVDAIEGTVEKMGLRLKSFANSVRENLNPKSIVGKLKNINLGKALGSVFETTSKGLFSGFNAAKNFFGKLKGFGRGSSGDDFKFSQESLKPIVEIGKSITQINDMVRNLPELDDGSVDVFVQRVKDLMPIFEELKSITQVFQKQTRFFGLMESTPAMDADAGRSIATFITSISDIMRTISEISISESDINQFKKTVKTIGDLFTGGGIAGFAALTEKGTLGKIANFFGGSGLFGRIKIQEPERVTRPIMAIAEMMRAFASMDIDINQEQVRSNLTSLTTALDVFLGSSSILGRLGQFATGGIFRTDVLARLGRMDFSQAAKLSDFAEGMSSMLNAVSKLSRINFSGFDAERLRDLPKAIEQITEAFTGVGRIRSGFRVFNNLIRGRVFSSMNNVFDMFRGRGGVFANLKDVGFENVEPAIKAIRGMATFINSLGEIKVGTFDTGKIGKLKDAIIKITDVFAKGDKKFFGIFGRNSVIKQLGKFDESEIDNFRKFFDGVTRIVQALNNIDQINIETSGIQRLTKAIRAIVKEFKNIDTSGVDLDRLEKFSKSIERVLRQFSNANVSGGSNIASVGDKIGADILQGLQDGIIANTPGALRAMENSANQVVGAAKDTFETRSPSRVFMRIGGDIAAGLGLGIKQGLTLILDVFDSLKTGIGKGLVRAIRLGIEDLPNMMRAVFNKATVVVDNWVRGVTNRTRNVGNVMMRGLSLFNPAPLVRGFRNLSESIFFVREAFETMADAARRAFDMTLGITVEFESAFAGVRKTLDAPEEVFDSIRQGLSDLATSPDSLVSGLEDAFVSLSRIAEAGGQLGVDAGSIVDFSDTIAQLTIASNLTEESASFALARIDAIFQSGGKNFDRLGSTIVALGNNLATTESDIVSLTERIIGSSKAAGLSESAMLGWAGAISASGIKAESGGTSFNTLLTKITTAVADGGSQLARFAQVAGDSSQDFAQAWEDDASGALQSFIQGLGELEGADRIQAFQDLGLGAVRMSQMLNLLAENVTGLDNALEIANLGWEENIALQEEARKRSETLQSSMNRFQNIAKGVGDIIGQFLAPAFSDLLAFGSDAMAGFSTMMLQNRETIDATISGITSSFGHLFMSIGRLGIAVFDIIEAFTGFRPFGNFWENLGRTFQNLAVDVENFASSIDNLATRLSGIANFRMNSLGLLDIFGGQDGDDAASNFAGDFVAGINQDSEDFVENVRQSVEALNTIQIQPGDTLWDLSIEYGTTVDELVRLNNITDPNLIFAGAELITSGIISDGISTITDELIALNNENGDTLTGNIDADGTPNTDRGLTTEDVNKAISYAAEIAEVEQSFKRIKNVLHNVGVIFKGFDVKNTKAFGKALRREFTMLKNEVGDIFGALLGISEDVDFTEKFSISENPITKFLEGVFDLDDGELSGIITPFLDNVGDLIYNYILGGFGGVGFGVSIFWLLGEALKQNMFGSADLITNILGDEVGGAFIEAFLALGEFLHTLFSNKIALITGQISWSEFFGGISSTSQEFNDAIQNFVTLAFDGLEQIEVAEGVNAVIDLVMDTFSNAMLLIGGDLSAGELVADLAVDIDQAVEELGQGIQSLIVSAFTRLGEETGLTESAEGVTAITGFIIEQISDAVSIFTGEGDLMTELGDLGIDVDTLATQIGQGLNELLQSVFGMIALDETGIELGGLTESFFALFGSIFSNIFSSVTGAEGGASTDDISADTSAFADALAAAIPLLIENALKQVPKIIETSGQILTVLGEIGMALFKSLANEISKMSPADLFLLGLAIAGVVSTAVAVPAIISIIGASVVMPIIGAITAGLTALATSPILLVGAALALGAVIIAMLTNEQFRREVIEGFDEFIDSIFGEDSMQNFRDGLESSLTNGILGAADSISTGWSNLTTPIFNAINSWIDFLKAGWNGFIAIGKIGIEELVNSMPQGVRNFFGIEGDLDLGGMENMEQAMFFSTRGRAFGDDDSLTMTAIIDAIEFGEETDRDVAILQQRLGEQLSDNLLSGAFTLDTIVSSGFIDTTQLDESMQSIIDSISVDFRDNFRLGTPVDLAFDQLVNIGFDADQVQTILDESGVTFEDIGQGFADRIEAGQGVDIVLADLINIDTAIDLDQTELDTILENAGLEDLIGTIDVDSLGEVDWTAIAADITAGLSDAIEAEDANIEGSATTMSDTFITGVEDAFGIASPSKVLYDIGLDVAQGLIDGVTEGLTLEGIFEKVVDKIQKLFSIEKAMMIGGQFSEALVDSFMTMQEEFTITVDFMLAEQLRMEEGIVASVARIISAFGKLLSQITNILNQTSGKMRNFGNFVTSWASRIVNSIRIIPHMFRLMADEIIASLLYLKKFLLEAADLVSSIGRATGASGASAGSSTSRTPQPAAYGGTVFAGRQYEILENRNNVPFEVFQTSNGRSFFLSNVGGQIVSPLNPQNSPLEALSNIFNQGVSSSLGGGFATAGNVGGSTVTYQVSAPVTISGADTSQFDADALSQQIVGNVMVALDQVNKSNPVSERLRKNGQV